MLFRSCPSVRSQSLQGLAHLPVSGRTGGFPLWRQGLLAAGLSLCAGFFLSPATRAGEPSSQRAVLRVGPLIGGQDLVVDFRSDFPGALGAFCFGFDKTPLIGSGPLDPVFGLNLATARIFLRVLDGTGRDRVSVPTLPGAFGPIGLGLAAHFQYVVAPSSGPWITSNTVSVEGEPLPVPTGFLVDEAATRLPAAYDTLAAAPVVVSDVDRDGWPDLLLATETEVLVWMNDHAGGFVDETAGRLPYPSGSATGVLAAADLNGDNRPDLVSGGGFDSGDPLSQPDRLWLNTNAGQYVEVSGGLPDIPGLTRDLEFADFDGDQDLDLVAAVGKEQHVASPTGKARLYLNTGSGLPAWAESTGFAAMAWNDADIGSTDIAVGDVDNDGDLDLLVARSDTSGLDGTLGQPNLLLVNDGLGQFTDVSTQLSPNPSDNTQGATCADFDLDGDLDAVFANSHASIPAGASGDLYVNQGGAQVGLIGAFVEDAASDLEISSPADWVRLTPVADDADADGDVDLIITVHDLFLGADQLLFLNQGGAQGGTQGELLRQSWFDPGDFVSYSAAFLDFDQDGDQDLVQTAQGVVSGDPLLGDDVRLYVNGNL